MILPPGHAERLIDLAGVPVWRIGASMHETGPLIVYLHGGGFVAGGLSSHRALAAWLAHHAQGQVLFVDYTLAPEGRFPVQIDQAAQVIASAITGACGGGGTTQVHVAGDSAGACLAIGAMLRARACGDPLPAAAILFCGMLELDPARSEFADANHRIRAMVQAYLGDTAVSDALANPGVAELAGLPPMLLQTGTADGCRADVERFHARATAAGVEATLSVWPDMFHVWQRFAPLLPEASAALAEAGAFIAAHRV
jgi:acetyl esterase/lipase